MRALVLTAGLGTRLRPLSYTRAKPAVPIVDQVLVRRVATWLAAHDVRNLVLNLHHRPETIARELGDGSDLGVQIKYSWEVPILGSAGGPRKALPLIDSDEFFVINGDTLTDVDLTLFSQAHAASKALVTLAVVENRWPDRYGGVLADDRGAVQAFVRRGSSFRSYHFIGVQLAHRSVFGDLPLGEPIESVGSVYPRLIAERPGSIRVWPCRARFWEVGTPREYLATALAFGQAEGFAELPVGRGSHVHPSARVTETALWDRVHVGADVELVRCVVGDGARIPDGARLRECAIVPAMGRDPAPGERLVGDLLVADMSNGPGARDSGVGIRD